LFYYNDELKIKGIDLFLYYYKNIKISDYNDKIKYKHFETFK
jgi:hypothetical protein